MSTPSILSLKARTMRNAGIDPSTIAITCIVLLVMCCSLARPADPGSVVTALDALASDELKQENRKTAAANTKEYCSIYASAIPTLSPREQEWLDQEMREGRAMSAIVSAEYFKKEAGERARYCVGWADILLERFAMANQRTVDAAEAWLWAQIASNLLDEPIRDYVPRLAQRGSIEFNEDEVKTSHLSPVLGRAILNRVLIPYLEP